MIARTFGMLSASALIALAMPAAASAQDNKHPIKVAGASLPDAVFSTPGATSRKNNAGDTIRNLSMHGSADGKLSSGVYDSQGKSNFNTGPQGYKVDEFMYFIKGGVKLTSADGTVTQVNAGDAVTLKKGWVGTWESPAYVKFYVIYDVNKPAK